jgi:hypothetical protein
MKVKKYKLGEEPENDLAYWKQKTPLERIQALEDLRQQYIKFFLNGVQPRFKSVYKITQLKQR